MAYVKDMDVHDAVMNLVDLLTSEPDPAIRMIYTHRALKEVRRELAHLRDRAAWEARQKYGVAELERLSGVNHGSLAVWAYQHGSRTQQGLPARSRGRRPMEYHDLSRLPPDRLAVVEARVAEEPPDTG